VRFSQFSDLIIIPDDGDGIEWKVHSPADARRSSVLLDAWQDFLLSPLQNDHSRQIFECIGIELFLNRGLVRQAGQRKRAHNDAIITGQHIFSNEELSKRSKISSRWAHERAMNYAECNISFFNE